MATVQRRESDAQQLLEAASNLRKAVEQAITEDAVPLSVVPALADSIDPTLTTREVATVLRLKETTVRSLLSSGTIPSVMIRGSRRVRGCDLQEYLDSLTLDRST